MSTKSAGESAACSPTVFQFALNPWLHLYIVRVFRSDALSAIQNTQRATQGPACAVTHTCKASVASRLIGLVSITAGTAWFLMTPTAST